MQPTSVCCFWTLGLAFVSLCWKRMKLPSLSLFRSYLYPLLWTAPKSVESNNSVLKQVSANRIPACYLVVTSSFLSWDVGGSAVWCSISAGCYTTFTLTVYHLQSGDWFHSKWSCKVVKKTLKTFMTFLERYLSLSIRCKCCGFWDRSFLIQYLNS